MQKPQKSAVGQSGVRGFIDVGWRQNRHPRAAKGRLRIYRSHKRDQTPTVVEKDRFFKNL